ncbi:MAG: hypothetical protein H8D87_19820 [Deltaproteobacteria bacterium]|nr:hypothetical protein [Candidatus Desulfobacula maris]
MEKELIIYSFSSVYVDIINNLGKLGVGLAIVFGVFVVNSNEELNQNAIVFCLIFFSVGPYLFGEFILSKYANKITIDFANEIIKFSMNRRGVTECPFDKIENIRVQGYIIISFNGRKIFYNDRTNKELISCLNRVKKISE